MVTGGAIWRRPRHSQASPSLTGAAASSPESPRWRPRGRQKRALSVAGIAPACPVRATAWVHSAGTTLHHGPLAGRCRVARRRQQNAVLVSSSECFSPIRCLLAPLRLLPAGATVAGRDSHPLGYSAFPRRPSSSGYGRSGPVVGRAWNHDQKAGGWCSPHHPNSSGNGCWGNRLRRAESAPELPRDFHHTGFTVLDT